jgi:hypothetical protein
LYFVRSLVNQALKFGDAFFMQHLLALKIETRRIWLLVYTLKGFHIRETAG